MKLANYFNMTDKEWSFVSSWLKARLENIIKSIISNESNFTCFNCNLFDSETMSGYAGEVLETGRIILDSKMLESYDTDVADAIIAHELAHAFCGHYKRDSIGLNDEQEADSYAEKWGFNVKKFRKVCGKSTCI